MPREGRGFSTCLICDQTGTLMPTPPELIVIIGRLFKSEDLYLNLLKASQMCLSCTGRLIQLSEFNTHRESVNLYIKKDVDKKLCQLCMAEKNIMSENVAQHAIEALKGTRWSEDYGAEIDCCYACYELMKLYANLKATLDEQQLMFVPVEVQPEPTEESQADQNSNEEAQEQVVSIEEPSKIPGEAVTENFQSPAEVAAIEQNILPVKLEVPNPLPESIPTNDDMAAYPETPTNVEIPSSTDNVEQEVSTNNSDFEQSPGEFVEKDRSNDLEELPRRRKSLGNIKTSGESEVALEKKRHQSVPLLMALPQGSGRPTAEENARFEIRPCSVRLLRLSPRLLPKSTVLRDEEMSDTEYEPLFKALQTSYLRNETHSTGPHTAKNKAARKVMENDARARQEEREQRDSIYPVKVAIYSNGYNDTPFSDGNLLGLEEKDVIGDLLSRLTRMGRIGADIMAGISEKLRLEAGMIVIDCADEETANTVIRFGTDIVARFANKFREGLNLQWSELGDANPFPLYWLMCTSTLISWDGIKQALSEKGFATGSLHHFSIRENRAGTGQNCIFMDYGRSFERGPGEREVHQVDFLNMRLVVRRLNKYENVEAAREADGQEEDRIMQEFAEQLEREAEQMEREAEARARMEMEDMDDI